MDLREEIELQAFLGRLEGIRAAAKAEFELRGPFPDRIYGRLLQCSGRILESMHAINVTIMKDPKASKGEAALLKYTAEERAQLCARISHLFSGESWDIVQRG